MFQTKLGKWIGMLFLAMLGIPLIFNYVTGGQSLFPTPIGENDVEITYPTLFVKTTSTSVSDTSKIRHSETPYNDVSTPYKNGEEKPATLVPRSTPYDDTIFQNVIIINHTPDIIRIIITSPNYIDVTVIDEVTVNLVYALHWIYIFTDNNVYVEQVTNDQLKYINVYSDKVIVGVYRLQK